MQHVTVHNLGMLATLVVVAVLCYCVHPGAAQSHAPSVHTVGMYGTDGAWHGGPVTTSLALLPECAPALVKGALSGLAGVPFQAAFLPPNGDLHVLTRKTCMSFNTGRCRVLSLFTQASNYVSTAMYGSATSEQAGYGAYGGFVLLPDTDVLYLTSRWLWSSGCYAGCGSSFRGVEGVRRTSALGHRSTFQLTPEASPSTSGYDGHAWVTAVALDAEYVFVGTIESYTETFEGHLYRYTSTSSLTFISVMFTRYWGSVPSIHGPEPSSTEGVLLSTLIIRDKLTLVSFVVKHNDTWDDPADPSTARSDGVYMAWATRSSAAAFDFVPDGPLRQINQFTLGNQVVRDAISLSDAADSFFVVAWDSSVGFDQDASGATVVARVYTSDGEPYTDEFVLPTSAFAGGDQKRVVISRGTTPTSFFAAWIDLSGSTPEVVVAVFSAGLGPAVPGIPLPFRPSPPVVITTASAAFPHAIAFRPAADGYGPDLLAVAAGSSVNNMLLTICADSVALVLDAAGCIGIGATPFALDSCLSAALALPSTGAGHIVKLAAGTWTSCPPAGVAVTKAIRLVGAGVGVTVVDCEGSGRAFAVDGVNLTASGTGNYVLAIAAMTVRGGATTPGVAGGPSGGCIALRGTLDVSTPIYLQDLVVSNCTVGGGGGGAVVAEDVGTLNINSCTFVGNTVAVGPGTPPGAFPTLYGGALLVTSTAGAPPIPLGAAYGVHVSNTAFVNNALSAPTSGATGIASATMGGGGAAVIGTSASMIRAFFSNVTFESNAISHGYGGGLLVAQTKMPITLGPAVNFAGNTVGALGSGGGLAVVDLFDSFVWHDSSCVGNALTAPASAAEIALAPGESDAGSGGCAAFMRDAAPHATLTLANVSATANAASSNGGGFYIREVSVDVSGVSRVGSNSAVSGGGILFSSAVAGSVATLSLGREVSVVGNMAEATGGGLAMSGGVVEVNGRVAGNWAGYVGGGVFVGTPMPPGGVAVGDSAAVTANSARVAGAGVFECIASGWCGAPDDVVSGAQCSSVSAASRVWGSLSSVSGNVGASEWASDGVMLAAAPAPPLSVANASVFSSALFVDGSVRVDAHVTFELRDAYGAVPAAPSTLVFRPASASTPAAWMDAVDGECSLPTAANAEEPGVAVASTVATSAACSFSLLRVYGASLSAIGSTFDANTVVVADAQCVSAPAVTIALSPCREHHTMVRTPEGRFLCEGRCGRGELTVRVGAVDTCEPCPQGTYNPNDEHSQTSCTPCVHGTYAYGGAANCKPCPHGGVCTSGARIEAAAGYWYAPGHADDQLDVPGFISCTPEEACPGGPDYSACSGPYHDSAFLCSKCAEDHAWAGTQCVSCWPLWVNIVVSALIVVVAGAFVASILRAMLAAGATTATQVIKVVISYLQILSLVIALELQRSRLLTNVLGLPASFANASPSFFSFACISRYSFRTVFYISLVAPALAVAIGVAVAAFVSRIGASAAAKARAATLLRVIIMSLFLAYPGLTREMLTVLHCRHFSELGEWRLVADLDIVCWTGEHSGLVVAALGGVVLYAIGIPVTGLCVLARARNTPTFTAHYAFFVTGYQPSVWYWEVVVAARKSAVVGVVVFTTAASQLALSLIVLLVSLATHAIASPFRDGRINMLDSGAHVVLLFTVLTALFVGTHAAGGVDGGWKEVLVVAAIAINIVFVAGAITLLVATMVRSRFAKDPPPNTSYSSDLLVAVAFSSDLSTGSSASSSAPADDDAATLMLVDSAGMRTHTGSPGARRSSVRPASQARPRSTRRGRRRMSGL